MCVCVPRTSSPSPLLIPIKPLLWCISFLITFSQRLLKKYVLGGSKKQKKLFFFHIVLLFLVSPHRPTEWRRKGPTKNREGIIIPNGDKTLSKRKIRHHRMERREDTTKSLTAEHRRRHLVVPRIFRRVRNAARQSPRGSVNDPGVATGREGKCKENSRPRHEDRQAGDPVFQPGPWDT